MPRKKKATTEPRKPVLKVNLPMMSDETWEDELARSRYVTVDRKRRRKARHLREATKLEAQVGMIKAMNKASND
jgi:hypothetical protein